GFTPMEVVTLRVSSSSILLLVYMLITSPKRLRLQSLSVIKYFVGTRILSIVFFNFCMCTTIELSTIPVATALLYTGPAFVTTFSFFLFKEPFSKAKVIALLITFIGTSLLVGLIPINLAALEWNSLLFGLGSGIGSALYSIFSKFALEKYSSLVITTFTFTVAAIALVPFFPFLRKGHLLLDPGVLFFAVGLGFLPTAIAYIIYTYGLNLTEASNASILTTVEPVVATLIGIFVFSEAFSKVQMLGMACIIGGVILIQLFSHRKINVKVNL